jgi:hypothetical protein
MVEHGGSDASHYDNLTLTIIGTEVALVVKFIFFQFLDSTRGQSYKTFFTAVSYYFSK